MVRRNTCCAHGKQSEKVVLPNRTTRMSLQHNVCIYIYIYVYVCVYLSLSLSLYIYIYIIPTLD